MRFVDADLQRDQSALAIGLARVQEVVLRSGADCASRRGRGEERVGERLFVPDDQRTHAFELGLSRGVGRFGEAAHADERGGAAGGDESAFEFLDGLDLGEHGLRGDTVIIAFDAWVIAERREHDGPRSILRGNRAIAAQTGTAFEDLRTFLEVDVLIGEEAGLLPQAGSVARRARARACTRSTGVAAELVKPVAR